MNKKQLTLAMCLMCASFIVNAGSSKQATRKSQYGNAFGIQLGSKFDKSKVIGNEILFDNDDGEYRKGIQSPDGSFVEFNDPSKTIHGSIYYEVKPSAPYTPFTHYYIGLTPRSSIIYKIVARSDDNLEDIMFSKKVSQYASKTTEQRHECAAYIQNISYVLGKKYSKMNEKELVDMARDVSYAKKMGYSAGNMEIWLSCDPVEYINDVNEKGEDQIGAYEQLIIVYSDDRLNKQRELEWDQFEKQAMDRKTKGIDPSKF